MDPFSIVVGSAALVETANGVATVLIDTYRSYTNAPTEMIEIADQLTTCSRLVDVFANAIKGTNLPGGFHYVAQNLVDQCQKTFKDVSEIVADRDRLKYAFGKKKQMQKNQKDLKRLQHMFLFLTTCYMYHPSQRTDPGPAGVNNLQGTVQNVPVQITMPNSNGRGPTVLYEATLTLKPTQPAESSRISSRPTDGDAKIGKHSLDNMRRSPYYHDAFLKPPRRPAAKYNGEHSPDEIEVMDIPSRDEASRDVDKLLSRWFLISSSTSPPPPSRPSARRPRAPEPPSHSHDSADEDFDHVHDAYSAVPYPEQDSFPPLRPSSSIRGDPPPHTYPLRPAAARPSAGSRHGSTASSTVYSPGPESGRGGLKGRGRRRSWDWTCDGCDGKFIYDDGNKQYQCMRCHDPFDFCEECLDHSDHVHGRREFAEVRAP